MVYEIIFQHNKVVKLSSCLFSYVNEGYEIQIKREKVKKTVSELKNNKK